MKKMIAIMIGCLVSTAGFAAPADVHDKLGNFIKVERNGDRISFQYCTPINGCTKYLGPEKVYSVRSLLKQRSWENGKLALSSVVFAALTVAGGTGGFVIAGFSDGMVATGTFVGGALVGGATGGGLAVLVRSNPLERYRIAATLDSDVLNDGDVSVKSVKSFARRLEIALENSED